MRYLIKIMGLVTVVPAAYLVYLSCAHASSTTSTPATPLIPLRDSAAKASAKASAKAPAKVSDATARVVGISPKRSQSQSSNVGKRTTAQNLKTPKQGKGSEQDKVRSASNSNTNPKTNAQANPPSPSVSNAGAGKPATTSVAGSDGKSESKRTLKLKNVKLVVEDVDDSIGEKLVPVDPVVLRQKPKSVPIVEVKRDSLVLPSKSNAGGINGDPADSQVEQEHKPILIVSKIQEDETPTLGVGLGARYSPFHPPAPGTFPSTLSEREVVNTGGQAGTGPVPFTGSELLPLPPVSNVGGLSNLDPSLPPISPVTDPSLSPVAPPTQRVARATAVNPALNSQFGGSAPSALGQSFGQGAPALPTYYTDSESSALLHMATDGKGFEGPSSSVFGQMW